MRAGDTGSQNDEIQTWNQKFGRIRDVMNRQHRSNISALKTQHDDIFRAHCILSCRKVCVCGHSFAGQEGPDPDPDPDLAHFQGSALPASCLL